MARYARSTSRRRSTRAPVRRGRSTYTRRTTRSRVRRRTTSGRAQTVRIVVQSAPVAAPSLTLSEAGRLLTPSGTARSKF